MMKKGIRHFPKLLLVIVFLSMLSFCVQAKAENVIDFRKTKSNTFSQWTVKELLTVLRDQAFGEMFGVTGSAAKSLDVKITLKFKDGNYVLDNAKGTIKKKTTTYKVSFDANGGTVSPGSKKYKKNQKYGDLPVPKKSGYNFLGWYTKIEKGTKATASTKCKKSITLYAHWEKKKIADVEKEHKYDNFNSKRMSIDDFEVLKSYSKIIWEKPYFILYKGDKSIAINRNALFSGKGYLKLDPFKDFSVAEGQRSDTSVVAYKVKNSNTWIFQTIKRWVKINNDDEIELRLIIEDSVQIGFRKSDTYIDGTARTRIMHKIGSSPRYFFFKEDLKGSGLAPTIVISRMKGNVQFYESRIETKGVAPESTSSKISEINANIKVIANAIELCESIIDLNILKAVKNATVIVDYLTKSGKSSTYSSSAPVELTGKKKVSLVCESPVGLLGIKNYFIGSINFKRGERLADTDKYRIQFYVNPS